MGRHRPPLRAASRGGRGGGPIGNRQRRLAAGVPGLALGQVRLRRRPGPAARRPGALRRLLPTGGGRAYPARRAGANPLSGHRAGRLPARSRGPGRRREGTTAGGDHAPRPRLDQGGAAGHGRVPAGPGDGHARDRRPGPGRGRLRPAGIGPAYEKVATAVVDYLATRADVDGGNVGLFGISLGGYYAARAAAREKRLRAVVDLAGPYRLDLDWDELPAQTRDTFRVRSGAASDDEARAKAGPSPWRRRPAKSPPRCSSSAAAATGSPPPTTRNAWPARSPRPSWFCTRTAATA